MNILHRVVSIAAAVLLSQSAAFAQGAFGPPPGQSGAPSPFPAVNGAAPSAAIGAPSAFPSQGTAPIQGGAPNASFAPPPQASAGSDACTRDFLPLREDAERRGKLIRVASERRAPPDEACKLIGGFSQAEIKMIKYVEQNSQKCGIPPQVVQQLKTGHKNTETMQKNVCQAAQQSASRGPAGPSLSEVLGSSSALPEATPTKRTGGSTFDTLNGNVLTR